MLQNIENPEISETSIPNESNEKELDSYLDSSNNSSKSNKNIKFNFNFKIILLGDSNVGKTSIFNRFLENTFNETYECTVQAEYKYKAIFPDLNTEVKLHIWDTSGSEKYKSITQQYYRDAHGIILIFDVCNRNSFNNLNNWISEIKNNCLSECQVIIVGNKNDIKDRIVSMDEGINFTKKFGYNYIDASAKSGYNILLIFDTISQKIMKIFKEDEAKNNSININKKNFSLSEELIKKNKEANRKEKKKKSCC